MENRTDTMVYEAPELTEVGDFADLTQGFMGCYPDAYWGFCWYS